MEENKKQKLNMAYGILVSEAMNTGIMLEELSCKKLVYQSTDSIKEVQK